MFGGLASAAALAVFLEVAAGGLAQSSELNLPNASYM